MTAKNNWRQCSSCCKIVNVNIMRKENHLNAPRNLNIMTWDQALFWIVLIIIAYYVQICWELGWTILKAPFRRFPVSCLQALISGFDFLHLFMAGACLCICLKRGRRLQPFPGDVSSSKDPRSVTFSRGWEMGPEEGAGAAFSLFLHA